MTAGLQPLVWVDPFRLFELFLTIAGLPAVILLRRRDS